MGSAREEALDPTKAQAHIASAIRFAQTLVAAVKSIMECRADIVETFPKNKRPSQRKAIAEFQCRIKGLVGQAVGQYANPGGRSRPVRQHRLGRRR